MERKNKFNERTILPTYRSDGTKNILSISIAVIIKIYNSRLLFYMSVIHPIVQSARFCYLLMFTLFCTFGKKVSAILLTAFTVTGFLVHLLYKKSCQLSNKKAVFCFKNLKINTHIFLSTNFLKTAAFHLL